MKLNQRIVLIVGILGCCLLLILASLTKHPPWPQSEKVLLIAIQECGFTVLTEKTGPYEPSSAPLGRKAERFVLGEKKGRLRAQVDGNGEKSIVLLIANDASEVELRYSLFAGEVKGLRCALKAGDQKQLAKLNNCLKQARNAH